MQSRDSRDCPALLCRSLQAEGALLGKEGLENSGLGIKVEGEIVSFTLKQHDHEILAQRLCCESSLQSHLIAFRERLHRRLHTLIPSFQGELSLVHRGWIQHIDIEYIYLH